MKRREELLIEQYEELEDKKDESNRVYIETRQQEIESELADLGWDSRDIRIKLKNNRNLEAL